MATIAQTTRRTETCGRCGVRDDGTHPSELDCVRAIDRALSALRAQSLWLRKRRVELLSRHVYRWQDERGSRRPRREEEGGPAEESRRAPLLPTAATASDRS